MPKRRYNGKLTPAQRHKIAVLHQDQKLSFKKLLKKGYSKYQILKWWNVDHECPLEAFEDQPRSGRPTVLDDEVENCQMSHKMSHKKSFRVEEGGDDG